MKAILCTVLVVVACFIAKTVSIRVESCYTCPPSSSSDECEAQQVTEACDCSLLAANCDRCVKWDGLKNGIRTYGKMCGTRNFCISERVGCQGLVDSEICEIHCCDEDDCNSATSVKLSTFTIAALVMFAVMKYIF